jgi:glycosyltransferase involved in cell wall biosynthesis
MNIVLVNQYAGSPRHGMEFRPHQLAKHWVASGHDVTIIAGSFSHLRNLNPTVGRKVEEEWIDGIRYRWVPTPRYSGNGMGRIRSIVSFLRGVDKERRGFLRTQGVDAVIASSTHPFDIDPCRRIAREHGATLVWEVHDLWPLSPIELGGYSPRHPAIVLTQRAEDRCCRDADHVVSILPKAIDHLKTRGLDAERYTPIPNGIDTGTDLAPCPEEIPQTARGLIQNMHDEGAFVIGYAGSHTTSYPLDLLIESVRRLEDPRIAVVFIGDGPNKRNLEESAADQPGIHFLDRMPRIAAISTLQACDAVFLGLRAQPLFRFGIGMNKIFDAMLVAKPVIASYTAGNDPISEAGCGITIPADSIDRLMDAITRIRGMTKEQRRAMGEAGGRFVREHHDYPQLSDRFLEAVQSSKSKGARSLPG